MERKDVTSLVPRKMMKVEVEDSSQSSNDSRPSPLMFLPKEIWTLIFNHVPQKHRLQQRLVNKEWCKIIDDFSTVDVNFNSDYPTERYRKRVFELRIRSCSFASLYNETFSPDFKNPLLIKEITFTTRVSASNLLKILSVCTDVESLKFLTTLSSEIALEDNEETTRVLNNLKNLQYLEIGILTFLDRNQSQQSRTFKAIIGNENVVFSSLKALNIAFLVRHTEWFQIFKFVSRHCFTLKSLNMICPCGDRMGCGEERKKALIPTDLVLPQLDSLVINGPSDCSCREDVWLVLNQQKNLRRFESDISRGLVFMTNIIHKNQDTIRTLKLHEIGSLYSDELDCSILGKCKNLLELSLFVAGDCGCVIIVNFASGGGTQHHIPILSHLDQLPKGLRKLTLCGSQISSEELSKLFSPGRALDEVTLGRANSMNFKVKTTGMTVQILIQMLENLEKLKKFRIFLDMISELECGQVESCGELTGIWGGVFKISKELYIANGHASPEGNDNSGRCCGEKYSHETCANHSPYIDMIFRNGAVKIDFLNRIKQLLSQETGEGVST